MAISSSQQDSIVCIAGGTAAYRREMAAALSSMYTVRGYENANAMMDAMRMMAPKAVIIDEELPPIGGAPSIQRVRRNPTSQSAPIVFTYSKENTDAIKLARANSNVFCLAKPFRRGALISAMSHSINATVEAQWEAYEPLQKQALKKTVHTFNAIADKINSGEPIEFAAVEDSCSPLIQAVQENNFKNVLRGVQGHDNYSYVHSMRVATFVTMFGNEIGIKGDDLMALSAGGLLHDVGKMNIPHEVLNKPGKLTTEEFEVMKKHVNHSTDYLKNLPDIPKGVLIIAAQHHEKLDGTGYPNGLKGTEINQLARIATIMDIFGAITDERVYKAPVAPEKALDIMTSMGGQLDQQLLCVFREMLLDAATL